MDATQPIYAGSETAEMSAPQKRLPEPGTEAGLTASTNTELDPPRDRRGRTRLMLAGLGAAAVAIVGWFVFARNDAQPEPTPPVVSPTTAASPVVPTTAAPTRTTSANVPPVEADAGAKPRSPFRGARPTTTKPASSRDPYGDRK